jgi:hypothetical protein
MSAAAVLKLAAHVLAEPEFEPASARAENPALPSLSVAFRNCSMMSMSEASRRLYR